MIDWMRFVFISMAIALVSVTGVHAEEASGLVLVADARVRSDILPLTIQEVRKAYLGITVIKDGRRVEALVNMTDETLYAVFLQKVMFMSSPSYQRQLARRFVHAQGRRPTVYRDRSELFAALSANPRAVTFVMWQDEVKRHANLKVVAVLWDGKS